MRSKPQSRGIELVRTDVGPHALHLAHANGVEGACGRARTVGTGAFAVARSRPHNGL